MRSRCSALILLLLTSGCATAGRETSPRDVDALWVEPVNLAQRDLFHGAGGPEQAPSPDGIYTIVKEDLDGFSDGYDVRDSRGRLWSVKLGKESQSEVVASRLLWSVGYHQPPVYYLPRWTSASAATTAATGRTAATGAGSPQPAARFRLEPESQEKLDEWSWRDNPFMDTRPFRGLFVLMVIINNWDLKTSQNAVYREMPAGGDPRVLYVIKDLGASFGKTTWPLPGSRNEVDDFVEEPFIDKVEGNRVEFHYQGGWREPHLAALASPADVRWIAGLLARLSPQQWADAFRAGGYTEADAARYIKRLQEKIADGQRIG